MSEGSPKPNGSMAATGALLGLLAIVAGVYAMIQPMNQRIDQLNLRLVEARAGVALDNERERKDAEKFAAMKEQFKEVETQFSSLREYTDLQIKELQRRVTLLESHGDARHDERIKFLETQVKALHPFELRGQSSHIKGNGVDK